MALPVIDSEAKLRAVPSTMRPMIAEGRRRPDRGGELISSPSVLKRDRDQHDGLRVLSHRAVERARDGATGL